VIARRGTALRTDEAVPLEIDVLSADRVLIARLAGELDARSAADLITAIVPLVEAGCRDVVLDCASLTFCDSLGLRALVVICRSLPEGGTCTLARPTPMLARLVEITALTDVLVLNGPPART
jgi:anti-sigma B factor antagonist